MTSTNLSSTLDSQSVETAQTDSDGTLEMESMIKALKSILAQLISLIEKLPEQSGDSGSQDQQASLGTDIIEDSALGQNTMETSNSAEQNDQATASANASVVINLDFDDTDNEEDETEAIDANKNSTSDNLETSNNAEQNDQASASASANVVINLDFGNADNEEDETEELSSSEESTGATKKNDIDEESTGATKEIDIEEESTGGWGDPHYDLIGANGEAIHFDHKGVDYHNYHLFTGDNIRIEGEYVPTDDPDAPQVIGSTTAYLGNDVVTFTKDGSATLNGEALENGSYTLEDGTEVVKSDDALSIIASDGTGVVDIATDDNSEISVDPSGKFRDLDGIIGKSIEESRPLSKEECDAFDLTEE
ncbi:MAG: hypothetical protein PVJ84_10645 [Desulfobacteraceae bacterium]|jgi:hypothetical protein